MSLFRSEIFSGDRAIGIDWYEFSSRVEVAVWDSDQIF
jgi:hypothetical protein